MRNLAGMRFGKLVAREDVGRNKQGLVLWSCACDCGNSITVSSNVLLQGKKGSCGCQKKLGNYKDLTGMKFGKLVVLEDAGRDKWGSTLWSCQCDCGNSVVLASGQLLNKKRESCGCQIRYKDLTGRKFGQLLAIREAGKDKHGSILWVCNCDCGNSITLSSARLLHGKKESCGCQRKPGTYKNLTGRQFGILTAMEDVGRDKQGLTLWMCECNCGNSVVVPSTQLLSRKSCGCLNKFEDLIGKQFNNWIVVGFSHKEGSNYLWKCKCKCGNDGLVQGGSLRSGHSKSCGCLNKRGDLSGMRFGSLTIIESVGRNEEIRQGQELWRCECDCGRSAIIPTDYLVSRRKSSCGCQRRYRKPENLVGKQFGKLLVIELSHKNKRVYIWKCKCECGKESLVVGSSLQSGHTRSCGCLKDVVRTHGQSETRTYRIWTGLKQRCYNSNNMAYKYYGGRGIKVCDRWLESFENFYADMGEAFDGMSIERIDNNGDYSLENCVWIPYWEQSWNTRGNRNVTFNGKTQCVGEWAYDLDIPYHVLHDKLKKNSWKMENIFRVTPRSNTKGIWRNMIRRCYSPNCFEYKYYGGRGIKVCDRWLESFENFYADMGEAFDGMSIERIDNNGDYSLENCVWIPYWEQSWNKRNNHNITFNGKTQCVGEWAHELGIPYHPLYSRLKKNDWDMDKALQVVSKKISSKSKLNSCYKGVI